MKLLTDKTASNAAYRAGLYADCGTQKYSPGRPRCSDCHTAFLAPGTKTLLTPEEATRGA